MGWGAWEHGSMGRGAWEHGEGHCRLVRRRAGAHRHRRRPPIGDKARSRSSDRLAAVIAVGWVVVAMVKAVRVLVVRVVVVVVVCSQRRTASRLPSGAVPSAMEMARRRISLPRGWQGADVATRWTDSAEGHEKYMHTAKHRLRHSRLKGWAAPS